MEDKDLVIKTENVKKEYKDNELKVPAVRGVDMTIHKGEFTAIIGPSGSGKTTLLNLISGLDTPTEGRIWLNGCLLSEMSSSALSDFRRDNIGFIFQSYNLIPVLTVEENIEYIMLLQGIHKDQRHKRVEDILNEVGLNGYEKRLPTKLSGGQQQRVAVARAMASKPVIILADEPTANLDSTTGGALLDNMRQLNKKTGMTFIFSTHDTMVMERAKRIITLKDGCIESDENK